MKVINIDNICQKAIDVIDDLQEIYIKEKLIERVYKNVKIEFAENQNNAGMLGALYNFKSR